MADASSSLEGIIITHEENYIPRMITDASGTASMDYDTVYEMISGGLDDSGEYLYTYVNNSGVLPWGKLSQEIFEILEIEDYPYETSVYSTADGNYSIYATIPSDGKRIYYHVSLKSGPEISVKVGGSWKTGTPYVKVGGAWKQAEAVYVKVNGVWKQST